MSEDWLRIWQKKGNEPHSLEGSAEDIVRTLLRLAGHDSKTANTSLEDWSAQIKYVADTLGIRPTDTVYEVGCGAGALLYSLQPRCKAVGGLDYSAPLLNVAKKILRSDDLRVCEGLYLPLEPKYDLVVSLGVFLYFPDADYARVVVSRMVVKAIRAVAVLDVNDTAKKEKALALRRAANAGCSERYSAPDQLFLDKAVFQDLALEHGLTVYIEDSILRNSINGQYRYNVFFFKGS